MKWNQIARILYPIAIVVILAVLLVMAMRTDLPAQAGSIRIAELSPDHPLIVRLAQGHTTAISFAVRPEKVVPGNPQALEINFLARDLTLRPLAPHPGNLIVYTKSSRYVILLQMGSDSNYDDVITVRSIVSHARAMRLSEDSFHIEEFVVTVGKQESRVNAELLESGKQAAFQDLPVGLRCKGCVIKDSSGVANVACQTEIRKLDCKSGKDPVKIVRSGS